jgi:hypothetical protein
MAATFMARPKASEEAHAAHPLHQARPILAENNDGTGGAVSDDPNSGPHLNRSADAVAVLGGEDDSLPGCLLHLIDGLLKSIAVIANSISMRGGSIRSEIDSARVFETMGVPGCAP